MLDLLEKYQTIVVGMLGFTGVIITMVVNARTQRNLQTRQREHDARSVRAALLVELRANVEMYESRIRDIEDLDEGHAGLIQSMVVNKIYQILLPKIGLLSAKEVQSVHRAYLLLEEMPYRLRLLVGTDGVEGPSNEFIIIEAARQKGAGEIHKALLPSIRNAVCALGENAQQDAAFNSNPLRGLSAAKHSREMQSNK